MRPGEVSKEPPSYLEYEEDLSHPLNDSYLAMVSPPAYVLPRLGGFRDIDRPLYDALKRRKGPGDRKANLILLDSESVPAIGTLVEVGIMNDRSNKLDINVRGIRQVKVNELVKRGPLLEVEIAPLTRPRSKVSATDMATIKAEFGAFAKANAAYRQAVKNPDYEAERVTAVGSSSALTNILLHHVPIPVERRQALLPLSDLERIRGIRPALKDAK